MVELVGTVTKGIDMAQKQQVTFVMLRATWEQLGKARSEFVVSVAPHEAKWMLNRMHGRQRKLSPLHVSKFERLISAGKFVEPSPTGVYVNQSGLVCNARHRLQAQANVGATLTWNIVFGASDEEIAVLDQTRSRRVFQSVNLATGARAMVHREEAAIKAYLRIDEAGRAGGLLDSPRIYTVEEILDARASFGADIEWAMSVMPPKLGSAAMVATLAYAYPVNREAVAEWVEAYSDSRRMSGKPHPADHPAVVFARWAATQRGRAGDLYATQTIEKMATAIGASLSGGRFTKLYARDGAVADLYARRFQLGLSAV